MKSLDKGVVRDNENYTEPKYYLGDLIPGTYCSRIFSDCDKKACRLQSPNYPGMYPRNLTCYYAVRQVSSKIFFSLEWFTFKNRFYKN